MSRIDSDAEAAAASALVLARVLGLDRFVVIPAAAGDELEVSAAA
jgi:hypothetical protein